MIQKAVMEMCVLFDSKLLAYPSSMKYGQVPVNITHLPLVRIH